MAASESVSRDNPEDWLIPEAARARSFAEIEARVDTALELARACEEAVARVGADAIESAAQARRAAELAERAALMAEAARGANAAVAPAPVAPVAAANPAVYPLPSDEDLRLVHFMERADRIVGRLRALQRI